MYFGPFCEIIFKLRNLKIVPEICKSNILLCKNAQADELFTESSSKLERSLELLELEILSLRLCFSGQ